jgi:endonuclease/exonuclease/phosphatase (EEP) superfamily protein YafD
LTSPSGGAHDETPAGRGLRIGSVLLVLGWAVTIALAAVVVARLVAFDRAGMLIVVNALVYWAFLPEYVVLAGAIAWRRHRLAASAAGLVAVHLVLVWPSLSGPAPLPAAALSAPRVRVFSANVLYDNRDHAGIVREIRESRADVVVLSEFSQQWQRALERTTLWAAYPHRLISRPRDIAGMAVLSTRPLIEPRVRVARGSPWLEASIVVEGRAVHLVGVHPVAPVLGYDRWNEQRAAITR